MSHYRNSGHVLHRRSIRSEIKDIENRASLREWWHELLRDEGRYSCYAVFLTLPSDTEALRYLTDLGKELDLISGQSCLVIALTKSGFSCSGLDQATKTALQRAMWDTTVKEQTTEGYSIQVAQLFDIRFDEFPCLVIFEDIRSPRHIVVKLQGMTVDEIAASMRALFSIIQQAVSRKQNPLVAIGDQRSSESLRKAGQTIVSTLRTLAGKTFETTMEAWIKANIK